MDYTEFPPKSQHCTCPWYEGEDPRCPVHGAQTEEEAERIADALRQAVNRANLNGNIPFLPEEL